MGVCSLYKYKSKTATHWVGKTGNEYPKDKYINHGWGGIKKKWMDLPADEYPYSIKYKTELMFKCCQLCSCQGKDELLIDNKNNN